MFIFCLKSHNLLKIKITVGVQMNHEAKVSIVGALSKYGSYIHNSNGEHWYDGYRVHWGSVTMNPNPYRSYFPNGICKKLFQQLFKNV